MRWDSLLHYFSVKLLLFRVAQESFQTGACAYAECKRIGCLGPSFQRASENHFHTSKFALRLELKYSSEYLLQHRGRNPRLRSKLQSLLGGEETLHTSPRDLNATGALAEIQGFESPLPTISLHAEKRNR